MGSDARPSEYVARRTEQQLDVGPERPARHIQVVDLDHLLERHAAAAEDLPRASHAGRQVQAAPAPALYEVVLVDDERARADQAHLALEDVDQLRQLVEGSLAEETPDARDARVVGDLEEARLLVEVGELVLEGLGVVDHRAELDDLEPSPIAADARLPEEDPATRVELHSERDRHKDGGGDDEP